MRDLLDLLETNADKFARGRDIEAAGDCELMAETEKRATQAAADIWESAPELPDHFLTEA